MEEREVSIRAATRNTSSVTRDLRASAGTAPAHTQTRNPNFLTRDLEANAETASSASEVTNRPTGGLEALVNTAAPTASGL